MSSKLDPFDDAASQPALPRDLEKEWRGARNDPEEVTQSEWESEDQEIEGRLPSLDEIEHDQAGVE